MSNTMRWRYGDTKPVMASVPEGVEIEVGDLLSRGCVVFSPVMEAKLKGGKVDVHGRIS